MRLVLKMLSYKGLPVTQAKSFEFTQEGGGIGRKADRTMVLEDPDKIVSGQHADILFANGQFLIRDTSSNGTYLVNSGISLSNAQAVLQANEIIRIGEYEILVELVDDISQPPELDLPSGLFADGPFAAAPLESEHLNPLAAPQQHPQESSPISSYFSGMDAAPAATPAWNNAPELPADLGVFSQSPFADDQLNPAFDNLSPVKPAPQFTPVPPVDPNAISNFLSGINAIPAFADSQAQPVFEQNNFAQDTFTSSASPAPVFQESALTASSVMHDSFTPPVGFHDPVTTAPEMGSFFAGLDAVATPVETVIPSPPVAVSDHAQAAVVVPQPQPQPVMAKPAEPVAKPIAAETVSPSQLNATLMQQFLLGAGIKDASFLPPEQWAETMHTTGALFRHMIEGLMEVLRARAEMKSEFRVSVTTLRSFDNNPLKFNPDVESVVKLLMGPQNPAFIKSSDAVRNAYQDIKHHQLAMTAGIQAALIEILHRFEPEGFEKVFAEGLVFQKKARCWELYCEKYPELKTLAMEEFFGESFADAYEKQMQMVSRS